MVCHVYNNKFCKVHAIECCETQLDDAQAHPVLWENLNVVMLGNAISNVNFKGFMANNAQANKITMRAIYNDDDPSVPLEGHKSTFLSIGLPIWVT